MKVALVYDRVNKWGGAERVLQALHQLFPKAPLFTSVHSKKAEWAREFDVRHSFLQKIPHAVNNHEFYPFLMPAAFENFNFDDFDLVISLTSEAAKGIITKPKTKHISYCLTPTRYLWSGYNEYLNSRIKRALAYPITSYLRRWDKAAANRPDLLVAASEEVRRRIKKYYGKESVVVYPPSDFPVIEEKPGKKNGSRGNYFLVVSRFVPYKKIDLAIEACNRLKLPLKIVGSGRQEKKLKKMAGPTIEFTGKLSDKELAEYYKNAKALIFPGLEDFGLTVVEAQSFGKPVVTFRGGGTLETIIEGKTGIFFDEQNVDSLTEALTKFGKFSYDEKACKKQAEKFSLKRFRKEFLSLVNRIF